MESSIDGLSAEREKKISDKTFGFRFCYPSIRHTDQHQSVTLVQYRQMKYKPIAVYNPRRFEQYLTGSLTEFG